MLEMKIINQSRQRLHHSTRYPDTGNTEQFTTLKQWQNMLWKLKI